MVIHTIFGPFLLL